MVSLNGFNAEEVKPMEGFDVLPSGKYLARIESSELRQTQAGNGEYVALTFDIIEGQFQGRKVFVNLNIKNPNQQAVDMAMAELSAICRAVGVLRPNDTTELHNIPLCIDVKSRKRKDNGELTNVVKGYHAKSEFKSAPSTSNDSKPPWAPK